MKGERLTGHTILTVCNCEYTQNNSCYDGALNARFDSHSKKRNGKNSAVTHEWSVLTKRLELVRTS